MLFITDIISLKYLLNKLSLSLRFICILYGYRELEKVNQSLIHIRGNALQLRFISSEAEVL